MPYGITFVDGSEYLSHKKWYSTDFDEDKKHTLPKMYKKAKKSGRNISDQMYRLKQDPKFQDKVIDIYAEQTLQNLRNKTQKGLREKNAFKSGMPSVAVKFEQHKAIKNTPNNIANATKSLANANKSKKKKKRG